MKLGEAQTLRKRVRENSIRGTRGPGIATLRRKSLGKGKKVPTGLLNLGYLLLEAGLQTAQVSAVHRRKLLEAHLLLRHGFKPRSRQTASPLLYCQSILHLPSQPIPLRAAPPGYEVAKQSERTKEGVVGQ